MELVVTARRSRKKWQNLHLNVRPEPIALASCWEKKVTGFQKSLEHKVYVFTYWFKCFIALLCEWP